MVDTNWEILAKERFNKNLDFSKIHSKEDYQYEITEFLRKKPSGLNIINAGQKSYYADGNKNPNYHKINYKEISEKMYEASKDKITELKKRKFVSLYGVYETSYTHTSSKGKVYQQKQYQDTKGRFVKNPFK